MKISAFSALKSVFSAGVVVALLGATVSCTTVTPRYDNHKGYYPNGHHQGKGKYENNGRYNNGSYKTNNGRYDNKKDQHKNKNKHYKNKKSQHKKNNGRYNNDGRYQNSHYRYK